MSVAAVVVPTEEQPVQCCECRAASSSGFMVAIEPTAASRSSSSSGARCVRHIGCASPMELTASIPHGCIELISGYLSLGDDDRLRFRVQLVPVLLRAVAVMASMREAMAQYASASYVDQAAISSALCPTCSLVMVSPISLPCCQQALCELCWMHQHLTHSLAVHVDGPSEQPVECVRCVLCMHVVAVQGVGRDYATAAAMQVRQLRCEHPGCSAVHELREAAAHGELCFFAKVECEVCGESVPRVDLKLHEADCVGSSDMDDDTDGSAERHEQESKEAMEHDGSDVDEYSAEDDNDEGDEENEADGAQLDTDHNDADGQLPQRPEQSAVPAGSDLVPEQQQLLPPALAPQEEQVRA